MKNTMLRFAAVLLPLLIAYYSHAAPFKERPLKILIITGGHGFQRDSFYQVFNSFRNIRYDTLVQPRGNELIASPAVDRYDVLVFYDLYDSITATQQEAYTRLLNRGKAMVFLHHSLVSYQHWPGFITMIGGKYHTDPVVVNGDTLNATYQHDVLVPVKVEDKKHPVTKGIDDFEIWDEVYGGCEILPSVHPLLSTTHPKSMRYVAWLNHYGRSEVVYIQLGHGPEAYRNPNYRKLVQQAIEWSAGYHKARSE